MEELDLQPSSGAEMRKAREEGIVLPFPSGENYRVRPVSAARLLRRGNLPNVLTAFLIDAIYNGLSNQKIGDFLALREQADHAVAFLDSMQIICEEHFMVPRVVANPQSPDELTIDDIPIVDQGWAFDRCFRSARELRPFRPQPSSDVVSVPENEAVPMPA
jgi:hypothetical protein